MITVSSKAVRMRRTASSRSWPHVKFGQQGVEASRHFVARVCVGVAADAKTRGEVTVPETARGGNELLRILGVEAALDGVSSPRDVLLRHRQGFALGHTNAKFDQVVSGDEFGHRMFDLDAWIDLEEVEIPVGVTKEFEGRQALVAHRFCSGAHQRSDFGALLIGQPRAFFDQFLVAALNGAEALAEVDGLLAVGQHLEFDVLGALMYFSTKTRSSPRLISRGSGTSEARLRTRRRR